MRAAAILRAPRSGAPAALRGRAPSLVRSALAAAAPLAPRRGVARAPSVRYVATAAGDAGPGAGSGGARSAGSESGAKMPSTAPAATQALAKALLDALLQQAALLPAPAPAGALEQLARAAEQAVALMAQQQAQDQRLMAQQQEQLERLQAQVAELQAQQERAVTAEQLADRDARIEALEAQLREAPARAPWLRSMAVGEALCEAVESGDAAQVNALLASGADVSYARQEDDMTPLLLAARDGRTALVEALLAPGAELEAAHPNDARPLHMAAHEGHAGVIRALLEAGAQKDAVRRVYMAGAMQPLHLAIRRNHLMAAKALLEAGADVEAVSGWFDWSPLHFAAGWNGGNAAMIRALHEAGADLESRATDDRIMHGVRLCTPLILAALYGFMEPVEALLAAGADTAARGEDGKTALEQARAKGHTEVAELLQRRG